MEICYKPVCEEKNPNRDRWPHPGQFFWFNFKTKNHPEWAHGVINEFFAVEILEIKRVEKYNHKKGDDRVRAKIRFIVGSGQMFWVDVTQLLEREFRK